VLVFWFAAAGIGRAGIGQTSGMSSMGVSGADLVRGFVEHSPFTRHVGLRLDAIEADRAELVLPFREELATYADVVHGGALSTLIDVAATAAAWSAADPSKVTKGATVGLAVNLLRAARGQDLRATARVARRGRSLCFCEVDVADEDGETVAKGLVTYKLGG
jgi:uncharacterized protein (TIGR00369 family)